MKLTTPSIVKKLSVAMKISSPPKKMTNEPIKTPLFNNELTEQNCEEFSKHASGLFGWNSDNYDNLNKWVDDVMTEIHEPAVAEEITEPPVTE